MSSDPHTPQPELAGSSSTTSRSSVLWYSARQVSGRRYPHLSSRGRRRLGTLKIISHNINGLSSKVSSAVKLWNALGADIVLLQETHLSPATAELLQTPLSQWVCYWAHNRPSRRGYGISSKASAGVGILIRKRCLVQYGGHISVVDGYSHSSSKGHHLAKKVDWMGHQLHLASLYLPSDSQSREQYIRRNIKALSASSKVGSRVCCWGGDFNFVADPTLDRISNGVPAISAADQRSAAQWAHVAPELVDCFRSRHPSQRAYSYHHRTGCSRLDRFYIHNGGMPYVMQSGVATKRDAARSSFLSDHRPAFVTLLHRRAFSIADPTSARHRGRSLPPKVHTEFREDPDLLEAYIEAVASAAAAAPPSARGLLAWWPSFKTEVADIARKLNTQHRRNYSERLAAAETVVETIHTRIAQGEPTAAGELGAARRAAKKLAITPSQQTANQKWLHARELPNPSMTARLSGPIDVACGPALKGRGGRLESAPGCCADIMVDHYAATSKRPTTCPAAQVEVLAALDGHAQLPAEACGSLDVSEAEVKAALKNARFTAPGMDRLPAVLYRIASSTFIPLLARLFTAIGVSGTLPDGFTSGVIVPFHKGGDRTIPKQYRPITLLNTDYRLLAALLGARLSTYLPEVIDPVQTAFLRGRSIGENILFLQLLPHALAQDQRSGLVAFCDFNKAYDTIDRSFLLKVMEKLGASAGLLKWVTLLLTATSARALVMGTLSKLASFEAGVRQGCPLAPLLYLFLGEALLAYLKSKGIGLQQPSHPDLPPLPTSILAGPTSITALDFLQAETCIPAPPSKPGARVTALQYADDFKAFLSSPLEVPAFVQNMQTFGAASGQHLNLEKSKLLPIGMAYELSGPTIAGLSVVSQASALGVTFSHYTEPARIDEEGFTKRITKSFKRISSCGLSAFGRGFASAAYGVSSFLHAAEFVGLSPAHSQKITQLISTLVDRDGAEARFAGVRSDLLGGPPVLGGFGALPLLEHLQARAAKWIIRAITHGTTAPWAALAWSLLARALPLPIPPLQLYTQHTEFLDQTLAIETVAFPTLPPPLQRLMAAATALPHLCRRVASPNGTISLSTDWLPLSALIYWRLTRHECYVLKLLQLGTPSWPPTAEAQTARDRPALWQYSVKLGTRFLSQPIILERAQRFADFTTEVSEAPGVSHTPLSLVHAMESTLTPLWKLPIANELKEPFWRCFMDALPTAARLHKRQKCGCGTGTVLPARKHHFGDCPIATVVLTTIQTHLPNVADNLALSLRSASPPTGIHSGIWGIVCLAACSAMDAGRRYLWRRINKSKERRTLDLRDRAGDLALRHFWSFLHETSSSPLPSTWRSVVGPSHPFMHWDSATTSWCITQT